MSGRYSFVAGSTLTASQLNTNVMDGIPYKIQVGTTNVTLTSNASFSYGSTNVTNLSGFTVDPYVVGAIETTSATTSNNAKPDAEKNWKNTIYIKKTSSWLSNKQNSNQPRYN